MTSGMLIAKAAAILTDKKVRKRIGWVIALIFSPIILLIVLIGSILSGGAQHNVKAIDMAFKVAPIGDVPIEFRESIENIRGDLSEIESLVLEVNKEVEEVSLDDLRVKAIFYALFYSETEPEKINISDFVNCFYYSVEKTKTEISTDEYGVETNTKVSYSVNIVHSDLLVVYQNISDKFGKEISQEEMENANEIYMREKYGGVYELPSDVPFVGIDGFVEPIADWQPSVSSEFEMRYHPITDEYSMHGGIDLAKPQGTQIFSVLDGVVTMSEYGDSYGYFVKIDHGDGFETLYAHCSKLLVKVGDTVTAGDKIALMGSTGDSTGPHLHFETIVNGERVNPRAYLPIK